MKHTLITGAKSSGKSTLANKLASQNPNDVVVHMTPEMIDKPFNDYLLDTDVVILELDTSKGFETKAAVLKQFLRETIVAPMLTINRKGENPSEIPNDITWIIVAESFDMRHDFLHVEL